MESLVGKKAEYIAELIVFDNRSKAPQIWFYDAEDQSLKGDIWLKRSKDDVNGINMTEEGKIKFTNLTIRVKPKPDEPQMLHFTSDSGTDGKPVRNGNTESPENYRYLDIASTDKKCDVAVAFKHLSKCGPLRGLPEKVSRRASSEISEVAPAKDDTLSGWVVVPAILSCSAMIGFVSGLLYIYMNKFIHSHGPLLG